jgi:hypothetical protein
MSESGQLTKRRKDGTFMKGTSGNPKGRPEGSKNVITLQKLALEEAFRESLGDDMADVLSLIVKQALDGHGASQKLIWDANVSKQNISDDKSAGVKQEIRVRTMNINRGDVVDGDFTEVSEDKEDE